VTGIVSDLRIHLLGVFRVERGGQALPGLEAGKAQELFCYLLLHRQRPHPREALADLLWGEQGPSPQARKHLRQALWQLQAAVDSPSTPVLQVQHDNVGLHPAAAVWCDAARFEQACAEAHGRRGRDLDPALVERLQAAAELYAGDLLEGCYQDWCIYQRERLQNLYLTLLDKLLEYCLTHALYESGASYGARLLQRERAHERTHRRLMYLYYRAGDRTAALRQYERCREALREELDVAPANRTAQLYEHIRQDRLSDERRAPRAANQLRLGPTEHLSRLARLRATLASLQCEVRRDLEAIDLVLERGR
jgi:DNA-binding SARP family transcriptional activator